MIDISLSVIIATIILIQMVLLSLGAQSYYKTPVRTVDAQTDDQSRPSAETNISVIS